MGSCRSNARGKAGSDVVASRRSGLDSDGATPGDVDDEEEEEDADDEDVFLEVIRGCLKEAVVAGDAPMVCPESGMVACFCR